MWTRHAFRRTKILARRSIFSFAVTSPSNKEKNWVVFWKKWYVHLWTSFATMVRHITPWGHTNKSWTVNEVYVIFIYCGTIEYLKNCCMNANWSFCRVQGRDSLIPRGQWLQKTETSYMEELQVTNQKQIANCGRAPATIDIHCNFGCGPNSPSIYAYWRTYSIYAVRVGGSPTIYTKGKMVIFRFRNQSIPLITARFGFNPLGTFNCA